MKNALPCASLLTFFAQGQATLAKAPAPFSFDRFVAALARIPVANPDPKFYSVDDSVPGVFLVRFAPGSYTPPPETTYDPATGRFGPAPAPRVGGPPKAEKLAEALSKRYGAKTISVADYFGIYVCRTTEKQARAMSHDSRVVSVETDAIVSGS